MKRFGIRFAICLVVLGGAYILVFGVQKTPHNQPNTPAAKVRALRTELDQTYIDSSTIGNFKQYDAASYATMGNLLAAFETDTKHLKTALDKAPHQVNGNIHQQIKDIITSNNQVAKQFSDRYDILLRPIAYDPATDLGKLSFSTQAAVIAQRAAAAQTGLKKAANDSTTTSSSNPLDVSSVGGSTTLVSDATKQTLLGVSDCFGKLASQTNDHQLDQAAATRASCIKSYPPARATAIQNVISGSFSNTYVSGLRKTIPPLFKQLDQLAAQLDTSTAQKPSR